MKSKKAQLVLMASLICMWTGCDPEAVVNQYFEHLGLTRLAALRDDVEPGALVLVGNQGAIYADNMFDYVVKPSSTEYGIVGGDGTNEINAILKKYTGDKRIGANLAVKFLQGMLPTSVDLSAKLGLTNSVTIDLVTAKVRRMKIPTLNKFLGSDDSLGFRDAVKGEKEAYVAYEVWRCSKLKITAEKDSDVSGSIGVGEITNILSEGKFSFYATRTSKSELEISGDKYYVFAIRTAHLVPVPGGTMTADPKHFERKGDVKGGGDEDETYSAPAAPNGYLKITANRVLSK